MNKNVGSQKLVVFAFDSTTNLPKTGDAANITAYVSKDYGSVTVLGDTSATEMDSTNAKGYYLFDLTQAETNGNFLLFTAKSATSNIVVIGAPAPVFTTPPNFSALAVTSAGLTSSKGNIAKNTALATFEFLMTDSTNHNPVTGKSVTSTRSIDGGSFGAGTLANNIEVGNGIYAVDFGAGDLNGNNIVLRCTASGCDDTLVRIITFVP